MRKIFKKVIIVLLLLLVVCSCSLKDEEVSNEEEVRDLTTQEIEDLTAIVEDLKYLDYYEKSFETIELSNQEVLRFIFDLYTTKNDSLDVTFTELEEALESYMDFPLEPENILCETHFNILGKSDYLYLLDIDTWKYYLNDKHESHSTLGFRTEVYNYFVSGEVVNNKYVVTFYKVFGSLYSEDGIYYFNYTEAANRVDGIVLSSDEQIQELFLNKDERLQSFTYTFEKDDDNYLLVSYAIN